MKLKWAVPSTLLLMSGCNAIPGSEGGGGNGTLKVGPLSQNGTAGTTHLRAPAARQLNASSLPASPGAFAFAKVDGLRFRPREVNLIGETRYVQAAKWDESQNKVLEVGSAGSGPIGLSESIDLPPGDYLGASIRFDGSFDVKAICRTHSKLVYTTATEVKAVDCNDCATEVPSDYDYFHSPFAYTTTAEGPASTTDTFQEDTRNPFTVTEGEAPQLSILVDNSFVVTCYDGTVALDGFPAGALSPFTWGPRHGARSDYFPASHPAFGLAYVPLFIKVSSDAEAPAPTAETYVASGTEAHVQGASLDFSRLLISTAVFEADGSILAMRSRNFDTPHGTGLYQMYDGFSLNGSGGYDFFNGEWYWDAAAQDGRQVRDRKVIGFTRQAGYDGVTPTTTQDGPDCGATLVGEFGNVARACGPNPTTVYWRRIAR